MFDWLIKWITRFVATESFIICSIAVIINVLNNTHALAGHGSCIIIAAISAFVILNILSLITFLFIIPKYGYVIVPAVKKILSYVFIAFTAIVLISTLKETSFNMSIFNLPAEFLYLQQASFILLSAFCLSVYIAYFRHPKSANDYEYYRDTPDNCTPAEVSMLFNGHVNVKDILATIMDLVRRKYLIIENEEPIESKVFFLLSKSSVDYNIYFDVDYYYENENKILPHEKYIIDWFFKEEHRANIGYIQRSLLAKETKIREFKEKFFKWNEIVKKIVIARGIMNYGYKIMGWLIICIMFIISIAAMCLYALNSIPFTIFVFAAFKVVKTERGAVEFYKWKAFKKFIEDFSLMEKAPALSVEIWEQYLVYSMSLGIAKTAIRDLKLNLPDVDNNFNDFVVFSGGEEDSLALFINKY